MRREVEVEFEVAEKLKLKLPVPPDAMRDAGDDELDWVRGADLTCDANS